MQFDCGLKFFLSGYLTVFVFRCCRRKIEFFDVLHLNKSQLRNPKVTKEDYNEFYKKTFNEYLEPLASSDFTTEGEVEFRSITNISFLGPTADPSMPLTLPVSPLYSRICTVEMCRGIQNPVLGLFLRSYLSRVSKDKLSDVGSEYEGDKFEGES